LAVFCFENPLLPSFFSLRITQPLLRYLTTIDFGKLVFERDFDAICARSGLRVLEKCLVPGSVDNAMQAAFLIVLSRDQ
jgi:hypothetical protein